MLVRVRLLFSVMGTGVPRSKEAAPLYDPTGGLAIGPYRGPGGGGRFLMREVPCEMTPLETVFERQS